MSTVPLPVIGDQGFDVSESARNITYLYGLSDFFSFLFEDTETLNILLGANAVTASEIYSRFLQLTSSLSLENIQTFTGASSKLILLKASDQEDPTIPRYTINVPIERVKLLTNRPFLPTEVLEENVDFRVIRKDINSSYIQFAKPLFDTSAPYKFSSRTNASGVKEYAIWLNDILVDEQLMLKHFGELIQVTPEVSSEAFSNFVYGLYYIYLNGPTLGLLKRGLNLVLGAPLARDNEVVLDIRGYSGTDQFLIITDQNQYLLPFGLIPSVSTGDSVQLGQLLAEWIEVKDYVHDGAWWLNFTIPPSMIQTLPPQQVNRFAVTGSPYDQLMRSYLAKNSFLVKVNVGSFKNTQQFAQISDVINRAKPTHTQAVYIWVVPDDDLTITLGESKIGVVTATISDIDHLGIPIELFKRDNLLSPVYRGGAYFTRACVPSYVSELVGEEPELGQNERDYIDGSGATHLVSGFRAYKAALTTLSAREMAWVQAASSTGNLMWNAQANQYSALGVVTPTIPSSAPSEWLGYPVFRGLSDLVTSGWRVVALHTTTLADINSKLTSLGLSTSISTPTTGFFISGAPGYLAAHFSTLFTKTSGLGSLGPEFPSYSYNSFSPLVGEVGSNDSILCYKITPNIVGVYWVTANITKIAPSLISIKPVDPLKITYSVPFNRNGALGGQPWYLTRGGSLAHLSDTTSSYTDTYNTTPITVNRSMGSSSWPSSGSLTSVNHVTRT